MRILQAGQLNETKQTSKDQIDTKTAQFNTHNWS